MEACCGYDELLRLTAWVDDCVRRAVTPEGLTVSQFEVLEFLALNAVTDMSELLERTGYRKSTLSRMLSRLAHEQLIEIRPTGDRDGRRRRIEVSDQGSQLVERVGTNIRANLYQLFDGLAPKTKNGVVSMLNKITRQLDGLRLKCPLAGIGRLWGLPRLSSHREAVTKEL